MQSNLFSNNVETILDDRGLMQYQTQFLDVSVADALLEQIPDKLILKQEAIQMFGRSVMQPRLTAWIADAEVEYEYSGLNSKPQPWIEALLEVKEVLQLYTRHRFNGVLCNYYRHGNDYMGWHSDDEKSLGYQPLIASLSLGADRRFDVRKKGQKNYQSITLQHNSLLLMSGDMQCCWQHRLPKERTCHMPRINLTFRFIHLQ